MVRYRIGAWGFHVLVCLTAASTVEAGAGDNEALRFDIPRQNAGDALPAFGRQADVSVAYRYDLVKDYETNRLDGAYTVLRGIEILLEDTGLTARFEGRHLVVTADDRGERAMRGRGGSGRKGFLAAVFGALFGGAGPESVAQSAEEAAPAQPRLEEIVVTAQKRQQRYVDVPVSVSTLSGEVLEMTKAREFEDLVNVSPSVTFDRGLNHNSSGVQIRGIGSTTLGIGVEPTVSTVVDGVPMGSTVQFLTDLADIERIEVLRGPQGTLFGKNASAGLINVITKRPSEVFESSVRASATDDDGWDMTGQVSGPFSDTVRGRLSAYTKEYDGYFTNAVNGDTLNGYERSGVRGQLEADLSDRVNLLLIGDYAKQDNSCCARTPAEPSEDPEYIYDWRDLTIDRKNTVGLFNNETSSNTETWGVSAEVNIDFDRFVVTSITGYRTLTLDTQQDVDGIAFEVAAPGRVSFISNGTYNGIPPDGEQKLEQLSQELRVTTSIGDRFDGVAGIFYWDQSNDRYFERLSVFCPGASTADPSSSCEDAGGTPSAGFGYMNAGLDIENWAVFGQGNWHISDRLTATLGLRYTEDDISFDFARIRESAGPAVPPGFAASNATSEEDLSGKVSLQWHASDDVMLYASYGEGYKAPAFDVIFGLDASRLDPVPAETSTAYEIGMKGEFFDSRLRLGVTAFRTDFDNLQGTGTRPDEIGFFLTSAGTARTQGLEVDFTARPTPNLLLSGGIAWVDSYFDSYPGGQCYAGQTEEQGCVGGIQDLSGEDIPNSPEFKYTVLARYDVVMDAPFDLYFGGNYQWQSDTAGDVNQDARVERESYGLLSVNAGIEAGDGSWSGEVFVKNALDDFYESRRMLSPGNPTAVYHVLSRDAWRYAGVEFTYRFGARR